MSKTWNEYLNRKQNNPLVHIKTDRETPGFTHDIEEFKIYYDSSEGDYRRKLQCECGADLGCFCFGNLSGAIESVDCTLVICDRCYLKEIDGEEADSIQSIMHDLYPDKTVDQMNDFEVERIMRFTREQHNDDYNDMDMEVCGV
jgi:hypothetical protein